MNKDLFFKMLERINSSDYYREFDLKKTSPAGLVSYSCGVRRRISFRRWLEFGDYVIEPSYGVRFDILHNWWAQFDWHESSTIRNRDSVFFIGDDFQNMQTGKRGHQVFDFEHNDSESLSDDSCYEFMNEVWNIGKHVFNKYQTLQDVYDERVKPILLDNKEMPGQGVGWVFIDLTLCKLVAPENYDIMKKKAIERLVQMCERKYPSRDALCYFKWMPEILGYLETTDIEKVKSTRKSLIAKTIREQYYNLDSKSKEDLQKSVLEEYEKMKL